MISEIQTHEEFSQLSKDSEKSILYMWAPWCGPCKMSSPAYKEISEDPNLSDISFIKVNVDDLKDIPSNFNVRSIPTFISMEKGEEKSRSTGFKGKEDLRKWISNSF